MKLINSTLTSTLFLLLFAVNAYCSTGVYEPAWDDPARNIEKVYNEDGSVFSETNLFSDRENGFYRTFHKNGKLAAEIRYKTGFQIYDKAFDENSQPIFRNGIFKTYYASGQLCSIGEYQNDMKNGTETFYYYDGTTVVDIWHYMNGRKVGSHIRNDAAGNFVTEEDWGYPSYYVDSLKVVIGGQLFLIMLAAFGLIRVKLIS